MIMSNVIVSYLYLLRLIPNYCIFGKREVHVNLLKKISLKLPLEVMSVSIHWKIYSIRIKSMYVNSSIVSSFVTPSCPQLDEELYRIRTKYRERISLNFSISEAFYKYCVLVEISKVVNLFLSRMGIYNR